MTPVEVPQVDDWLQQRGFGGRLGFGAEPALLVIDMMNGFTDPDLPLGSDQGREIGVIARLLAAARAGALPVFLIVSSYAEPDCADAGVWRFKQRGIHTLVTGSHASSSMRAWRRRPATPSSTSATPRRSSARISRAVWSPGGSTPWC